MPLPGSLTIPGPLIVIGIIALVVLISAATLLAALNRHSSEGQSWGRAFSGAREKQRQQTAQMDELHRAVQNLSTPQPKTNKSNE